MPELLSYETVALRPNGNQTLKQGLQRSLMKIVPIREDER